MTSVKLLSTAICFVLLAQPCVAQDNTRFLPLADARSNGYLTSGNKFLPLRAGAPTTIRPRIIVQNGVREVRAMTATSASPATATATPTTQTASFAVKRYEPQPRATFRLRGQPAPTERLSVSPIPRDNNGNKELTSNAPYSASFYGASNIGLTEHTWPVELSAQQRISSGFGMRNHPVTGRDAFHKGVDIAAATGSDVIASADGVVEETGQDMLIGKYVRLRHPDGSQSLYGHLSAITVQETNWLNRHDKLGEVGSTGRTTGPHLHYALNLDGKAMDPMDYLTKPSRQVAAR
jgi:murein DD-endopeptidase MepM/ murein hydrolase activator NlpD